MNNAITDSQKILNILDHYTKQSFVTMPLVDPDGIEFDPTPFKEQKSTVPGFKTEYVLADKNKKNPGKIAYKLFDNQWIVLDFDVYGCFGPLEGLDLSFINYYIATD